MVAGLNVRFNVVRYTEMADDYVGGASLSGTVQYTDVMGRLEGTPTDQLLLAQGLETNRIFRVVAVPGTLDVREHDQLVLTFPTDHPYYNKAFRVIGMTHSNFTPRDRRDYLIIDVSRDVIAHSLQ